MKLLWLAAVVAMAGCAVRKPASVTIPQECIQRMFIVKPKAQCVAERDGKFVCKDFAVEASCTRVSR